MRWFVVLALAGCGRIGFDAVNDSGSGDDTMRDGALVIDGMSLGTGPFNMPTQIPMPNLSSTIDDPSETADGLELYVNVGVDVWVSVRSTTTDPWPLPTKLFGAASPITYSPHISPDGLTLWCVDTGPDLSYVTRPTRASTWPNILSV